MILRAYGLPIWGQYGVVFWTVGMMDTESFPLLTKLQKNNSRDGDDDDDDDDETTTRRQWQLSPGGTMHHDVSYCA